MPPFLVCVHDATPAFARETWRIIRDLSPRLEHRFALGVVPNWHGEWPLDKHGDFCRMVRGAADELMLHGFFHHRPRGAGPVTLLAGRCDEMNGLSLEETERTIDEGQRVFAAVFGEPARGFL